MKQNTGISIMTRRIGWGVLLLFCLNLTAQDLTDELTDVLSTPDVQVEESVSAAEKRYGPAPSDLQKLEAESLSFTPGAWEIKERKQNYNRYTGAASDGKMLCGSSAKPGEVKGTFTLPKKARYYMWVRYVDNNDQKSRSGSEFTITVRQNNHVVETKTFDEKHIPRKHDRWFRHDYQWAQMEFDAAAGKLDFVLSKTNAVPSGDPLGRTIDCILITADRVYLPHVYHLHPVFVRFKALPQQKQPIKLQVAGLNADKGNPKDKKNTIFSAGEQSKWIYLSEWLKENAKPTRHPLGVPINPYARGDVRPHYFEAEFSTTPSEKGIFKKISHAESGLQIPFTLDPASKLLETDLDWSAGSLRLSSALPPLKNGVRPVLFPFGGSLALAEECWSTKAIENELQAQKNLGLNDAGNGAITSSQAGKQYGFGKHNSDAEFMFHLTNGCICSPNRELMEQTMKKKAEALKKQGLFDLCSSIGVMDEPQFGVSHVMSCKSTSGKQCRDHFHDYLRKNKVSPTSLGKQSMEEVEMSREPGDGLRFYWTVRYRNHVLTEFLHTCTEVVKKSIPHARSRVNIATELVTNGNMVQFGVDWFEIFNSGALTSGETEDWSNLMPTYQVAGYIADVMRGACKRTQIPFSILNILGGRSSTEIQAKGFSEIGRGASSMGFFRYGPSYSGASDSVSHVPEVHEAIRNITYPTGAVESYLLSGTVAKGDAAMLLSVTGDIYQILTFSNPYGRERMWLHLLLTHSSRRLDILGEQDLKDYLNDYRYLFVTDANIRREYLSPLLTWIQNGGTLIMTAGALTADEANQDLGFDRAVNLKRGKMELAKKSDAGKEGVLPVVKADGLALELPVGFQTIESGESFLKDSAGRSIASELSYGKGKIIVCGFMPGLAYIRTQTPVKNSFHSNRLYPPQGRAVMKTILDRGKVPQRIDSGHPLVEAMLIESPKGDVIILSNWSPESPDLKIQVNSPWIYKEAVGVPFPVVKQENQGGFSLSLRMTASEKGGYILLKK